MTKPCPWDDCIYPSCNAAMGCEEDQHTERHRVPTLDNTMMDPHTGHERPMTEEEQWKADRHREHISPKR